MPTTKNKKGGLAPTSFAVQQATRGAHAARYRGVEGNKQAKMQDNSQVVQSDGPTKRDLFQYLAENFQFINLSNLGADYESNPQLAMSVNVVGRCVNLLSGDIGNMPWRLFKRNNEGEKQLVESHDVLNRLRRPGYGKTETAFKKDVAKDLLTYGNAYIYKNIQPRTGRVLELQVFSPSTVSAQKDGPATLKYYATLPRAGQRDKKMPLDPDRMIHLRWGVKNPSIPIGTSIVKQASRVIALYVQQQSFIESLAVSQGLPSGIFKQQAGANVQDDDIDDLVQQVNEMRGKANRVLFTSPGMDFKQISMSSSDAELLASFQHTAALITNYWGVPLSMINIGRDAAENGRGSDSQERQYYRHTLQVWAKIIEQGLTLGMFPDDRDGDYSLEFDSDPLTQATLLERSQAYDIALRNGAMSPNEFRKQIGLKRRDDPAGDEFHMAPGTSGIGERSQDMPADTQGQNNGN